MARNAKRWRTTVAVGLGAALLVSACGGGGGAATDGENQFTYWSMWKEGEPQQKALAQSIAAFTAETGIKVDVQWQGRDVLTKLQPTLNTTPAADLIDRNLMQVKSIMVSSGTAADLSPLLETKIPGEERTVGEVIPENYLKFGKSGDQLVVLPFGLAPYAIWYDGSRFPGLKPDDVDTWDEFQKVLDDARAEGGAPLALDGDVGGYNELWYAHFVVSRLGAGALHKAAGDKTGQTWNDPGYLAAAERVETLVKGGYFIPGYDASKFPAIQQKWATGKASFLLMGSWVAGETAPYASKGFEYRSIPFPNDGTPQGGLAASDAFGWVMPTKAERAEPARRFIAFMYGKSQVQRFVSESQTISARADVTPPASIADAAKMLQSATTVYDSADGVGQDYADWRTKVFAPLVNKLLAGSIGAREFVDSVREQSVDYWKRNS